jgi:membrane protease YdiL (CAAX protease family)
MFFEIAATKVSLNGTPGPAEAGPGAAGPGRAPEAGLSRLKAMLSSALRISYTDVWPRSSRSASRRTIPMWFSFLLAFAFLQHYVNNAAQPEWTRWLFTPYWWKEVVAPVIQMLALIPALGVFLGGEGLTFKDLTSSPGWGRKIWAWGLMGGLMKYLLLSKLGLKIVRALGADGPANVGVYESYLSAGNLENLIGLFYEGVVVMPIVEEILFRGYALASFKKTWGTSAWKISVCVLITSVLFAYSHRAPSIFYPLYLASGISYSLIYLWSRSLNAAILAHAAGNFLYFAPLILWRLL